MAHSRQLQFIATRHGQEFDQLGLEELIRGTGAEALRGKTVTVQVIAGNQE
jgi:hypothetical protein